MSNIKECANLMRTIIGEKDFETCVCKVTSVNGATCNVERVLDGKIIKGVRLNSTIKSDDGLVIIPKTGSYVLVTNIDGDKCFVSQFSEIEKITLNVANNIEINGGENGGIVIVEKLKDNLQKINDFLTILKNTLGVDASGLPSTITEPGNGAPSALATALGAALLNMELPTYDDIENSKITH